MNSRILTTRRVAPPRARNAPNQSIAWNFLVIFNKIQRTYSRTHVFQFPCTFLRGMKKRTHRHVKTDRGRFSRNIQRLFHVNKIFGVFLRAQAIEPRIWRLRSQCSSNDRSNTVGQSYNSALIAHIQPKAPLVRTVCLPRYPGISLVPSK